MGRMPYKAAPIPTPTMDSSASGESITRSSPYFSNSPMVARKTPPRLPTSSPTINTLSSRPNSSSIAWRMASIRVISATTHLLGIHREHGVRYVRVVGLLGKLHRIIHHFFDPRFHLFQFGLGEQDPAFQGLSGNGQRIRFFGLVNFLARAVGAVIVIRGMRR